jgi:hypothetical protein
MSVNAQSYRKQMTNNKQQTAVEWLQSIELERDLTLADWKQAQEMDKQRIAKAFTDGKAQNFSFYDKTGEQYYNETYGNNHIGDVNKMVGGEQ